MQGKKVKHLLKVLYWECAKKKCDNNVGQPEQRDMKHALNIGMKPERLEETHTNMGTTRERHTAGASSTTPHKPARDFRPHKSTNSNPKPWQLWRSFASLLRLHPVGHLCQLLAQWREPQNNSTCVSGNTQEDSWDIEKW